MTEPTASNSGRKRRSGRPTKSEGGAYDPAELDRLLVYGEADDTGRCVYPSYRDLAKRLGVSGSVIASYSKRYNCLGRREAAQREVRARAHEQLVAIRAAKLTLEESDVTLMVDKALLAIATNLGEGRFRCDTVSDLNLLVRLRAFLRGDADSRQEMLGGVTLDDLEREHRSAIECLRNLNPVLTGIVRREHHQAVTESAVTAGEIEAHHAS